MPAELDKYGELALGVLRASQLSVLTPAPYGLTITVDLATGTEALTKVVVLTSGGIPIVYGSICAHGDAVSPLGLVADWYAPYSQVTEVSTLVDDLLTELETRTSEDATEWADAMVTDWVTAETTVVTDIAAHRLGWDAGGGAIP